MKFTGTDPKVVISDTPPPTVVCRSPEEQRACESLLQLMRRGFDPIVVIGRQQDGTIEAHAKSASFPSLPYLQQVMQEATAKLLAAFFKRNPTPRKL